MTWRLTWAKEVGSSDSGQGPLERGFLFKREANLEERVAMPVSSNGSSDSFQSTQKDRAGKCRGFA